MKLRLEDHPTTEDIFWWGIKGYLGVLEMMKTRTEKRKTKEGKYFQSDWLTWKFTDDNQDDRQITGPLCHWAARQWSSPQHVVPEAEVLNSRGRGLVRGVAAPANLCHKEPARASNGSLKPYLTMVLYGIREPVLDHFLVWKPTILLP